MRFVICLLAVAAPLVAQQPDVKFTSNTQLVVQLVTVKDKSGKALKGLTANDFSLTENGEAQKIAFCDFQKLLEADAAPDSRPAVAVKVEPANRTQISPEPPGDIHYRDRRLLALYFDMTAMPPGDQLRALTAGLKFIRTQMSPPDLLAILVFRHGAVEVLDDFTNSHERLEASIQRLVVGEDQGNEEDPNDASNADTGAAFGQDNSEFNIFNTDRQLAALQTAVKMLGRLNEKKALVYFASGLQLNGVDNQAQLQATANAAIRANVVLYPVDSRGLIASAPMGDAAHGSPGGVGMYAGTSALAMTSNFQRSQDVLYALGTDTGGKALLDNNDLARGIVQAQQSISSYYIIGYYTTNLALDGKLRKIKITLNGQLNANLSYRQGFYAAKQFSKFTAVDKERQLEDALMLGDPITELTIALEVDYFQLNRAEYFVPVTVKIPGSELALARKGGAERTLIDFIGEVKDEYGTTVSNVRDKVDIKLSGATAAELGTRPIGYDTGFTLLPGTYSLKFLARDAETGRMGTFLTKFVVPNLMKEEKRVPISSVVLSSQRLDMHDALFSVGKEKERDKAAAVNPLILDGQKLIPSVTRVFSRSRDMYVYLQAYERAATATQPLVAFVTFFQGDKKVFETPLLPVMDGLDAKSKAVPLRFSLALGQLSPGRYQCQVSVIDPTNQKAAFWQAPVVLIP